MVRTPGFHPGNRGSIPLETTKLLFVLLKEINSETTWEFSSSTLEGWFNDRLLKCRIGPETVKFRRQLKWSHP